MQGIMTILVRDDLSYAKVEIKNVSVKYYEYRDDIVNNLFKRFKCELPAKVEFGSRNRLTGLFVDKLMSHGYIVEADGSVYHHNDTCFNSLEHQISDELPLTGISIRDENNYRKLVAILSDEGYEVTGEKVNNLYVMRVYK